MSLIIRDPERAADAVRNDFAVWAKRCEPAVVATIARDAARAGVDVHDVVQEAVSRGLAHAQQLTSETQVQAWLTVVARRIVVDRVRSAYSRRVVLHPDTTRYAAACGSTDPISATIDCELGDKMHSALASLPASQRRALVAQVVEGKSRSEIARELGLSETAVGPLLYRATRALRQAYARLGAVVLAPAMRLRRYLAPFEHVGAEPGAAVMAGTAMVVVGSMIVGGGAITDGPPGGQPPAAMAAAPEQSAVRSLPPVLEVAAVRDAGTAHRPRGLSPAPPVDAAAPSTVGDVTAGSGDGPSTDDQASAVPIETSSGGPFTAPPTEEGEEPPPDDPVSPPRPPGPNVCSGDRCGVKSPKGGGGAFTFNLDNGGLLCIVGIGSCGTTLTSESEPAAAGTGEDQASASDDSPAPSTSEPSPSPSPSPSDALPDGATDPLVE